MPKKIRLGILGGGGDSLIGVLHRVASFINDNYEIVGAVFNPDYEENIGFAKKIDVPTNRIYKDFDLGGGMFSIFLRAFNLLDWDNPTNVYADTGDPLFTIPKYEAQVIDPTLYTVTLDELFTNPTFFSSPRRIELGLSYNF